MSVVAAPQPTTSATGATLSILAPLSGQVWPLERIPDPVFAQKMVGDGLSIDPVDSTLLACCDGEVIALHGPDLAGHLALEPHLALYEAGGSFLDPKQSRRLLFHEEVTQGGVPAGRRVTYRFTRPGRYLLHYGNHGSSPGIALPVGGRVLAAPTPLPAGAGVAISGFF